MHVLTLLIAAAAATVAASSWPSTSAVECSRYAAQPLAVLLPVAPDTGVHTHDALDHCLDHCRATPIHPATRALPRTTALCTAVQRVMHDCLVEQGVSVSLVVWMDVAYLQGHRSI